MDWLQRNVGLNSSLPAAWDSLVAAVTDQSQALSKVKAVVRRLLASGP